MRRQSKYKRGQWRLQRERLQIGNPETPVDTENVTIGQVIPSLMRKLGLKEQHTIGMALEDWPAIVGPAVAGHTRPGSVRNGRMVVFVDSAVWLSELTRCGGREQILANVRRKLGYETVRSIVLQADPDGPRKS